MTRTEALQTYIQFAAMMVARDRHILGWTNMSKLQSIADRAVGVVAGLEARAGRLDDRLTKLESTGNGVFDRWDGHVSDQEKAVAVAEDAINKLSNGGPPLEDSSPPFRQPGAGGGTP